MTTDAKRRLHRGGAAKNVDHHADSSQRSRYVVAYEDAGDVCRRAFARPVARVVVDTATDVGALVESLLAQGAVRLRVHAEEVVR